MILEEKILNIIGLSKEVLFNILISIKNLNRSLNARQLQNTDRVWKFSSPGSIPVSILFFNSLFLHITLTKNKKERTNTKPSFFNLL